MDFVSAVGEPFATPSSAIEDITKELKMRGVVYKPRIAEESLNAIINGAHRAKKITIIREIETPGFYFVDGKIVGTKVSINNPSTEDIRKCAEFLNELIAMSKHPETLISGIKWGIMSPFNFVLKQLSENGRERWLPWLYLDGHTQTSKTTDGQIILSIYRRQNSKTPFSSTNNVARLGKAISHDTFPRLIDEVKLDPKNHSELIEAIKHAVQGQRARTRLTKTYDEIHIAALSSCILTSNHQLPFDPALRRRFLRYYYPKDHKPSQEEINNFESFLKPGWNSLATLGDFAISYLMTNQEIITNEKNDWIVISKMILVELYKAANLNLPDWIDMFLDGNQNEDAEAEEEEIIRGFFKNKINGIFSRNYKSIVPWEEQKDDSSINKNRTIESRLNFCLDSQLIPFLRRKNSNSSEILITKDILNEIRNYNISSIQHLTDLAVLLGADHKPTKVDRKPKRALIIELSKLIDFIEKDPSK
jgi:uracil-DNA glycosylase